MTERTTLKSKKFRHDSYKLILEDGKYTIIRINPIGIMEVLFDLDDKDVSEFMFNTLPGKEHEDSK